MISHALEKKESSNTNTKSSFFSSIVAFCRQNCSALLSKEEERSPSFLFSLSLSVSFPRFVVSREETVREEKEKEKEAGRRLLPVLVKSLGDTRDSDWISQSRCFFFIAVVRGRGSTFKTRGGIQQSVEKRQSRRH